MPQNSSDWVFWAFSTILIGFLLNVAAGLAANPIALALARRKRSARDIALRSQEVASSPDKSSYEPSTYSPSNLSRSITIPFSLLASVDGPSLEPFQERSLSSFSKEIDDFCAKMENEQENHWRKQGQQNKQGIELVRYLLEQADYELWVLTMELSQDDPMQVNPELIKAMSNLIKDMQDRRKRLPQRMPRNMMTNDEDDSYLPGQLLIKAKSRQGMSNRSLVISPDGKSWFERLKRSVMVTRRIKSIWLLATILLAVSLSVTWLAASFGAPVAIPVTGLIVSAILLVVVNVLLVSFIRDRARAALP